MQGKNLIGLFLILISLLGCAAPATSTSLPISVETPTPTIQPTSTPSPLPTATRRSTATPTSTATPEIGLRTGGPFFAYFRQVNEQYQFVLMDADGMGRKIYSIPSTLTDSLADKLRALDTSLISPDGNWLAIYTGWAGVPDIFPPQGTFDLSLSLLNLSTGELQVVTPVLSGNYPNNFKEAAEQLSVSSITAVDLYNAFLAGLRRSLAWSPDGHYLAFAGQIDGLSSDLYVYDLVTKTIRRLSSGNQEIQSIEWSPDGKWILHSGTYKMEMGMEFDVYVADLNGLSVNHLSTASSNFRTWSNQHTYIEHDNENVFGNFGLRLVDVNTGQIKKIWDGPVIVYGLNAKRAKFVFATHMFSHSPKLNMEPEPDFVPGLYLMDLNSLALTRVEIPDGSNIIGYFVDSFNVNEHLFTLTKPGYGQKPFLLSDNGELMQLDIERTNRLMNSPDSSYWIAITNKTIEVYSAHNEFIKSVPLPFQDTHTAFYEWRLDSSGLFVVQEPNIYYLNIGTGEMILVESDLVKPLFHTGYRWINEN